VNRLITGSETLARRVLTAWFGDGPKTAALRLLGAAIPLVLAGSMLRAHPALWALLALAWGISAWRAAPPPRRKHDPQAAKAAFVQLLRDCIGDRNGVLLADVLATAQAAGLWADWDIARVREGCDTVGVRVRDSIKVDGRVSAGVHRDDLEAAHPTAPPTPSGTPPESGSSAGQPETTSATTPTPERGSVVDAVTFEDHLTDALNLLGGGR
jgi:hypothetical protein